MGKFGLGFKGFSVALALVFLVGCGQETVNIPDTTRPVVLSTLPANGAVGVPLNQAISATFSKPMNSATINSTTFTVTAAGGVAVAGTVSYVATGSVATFTPTAGLAPGTVYTATITTGAQDQVVPPNALAANYVWTFTTVVVPPTVTATTPANAATGVALNSALTATFSKALNPATVTATSFKVTGPGGVAVAGAVTYSGVVATFVPTAALAASTQYTATITTGVQDVAGDPLAANYVWTFTTVAVPPVVISTVPANNATGIALSPTVGVTFNEALNPATVGATSFTVMGPGGVAVPGSVTYAGVVATFVPTAALAASTKYTVTITTAVKDVAGDPLAANFVSSFTTVAVPPTVVSTFPVNNATGVALNPTLGVTFNEALNPATVNGTTVKVTGPGGAAVAGSVSYAGVVASFIPAAPLTASTQYTVTVTTGVQDVAGDPLAANYVTTFTTMSIPPTVVSTFPVNNATGVALNPTLGVTFNEALNPATVNGTTIKVTGPGGAAVAGSVSYAGVIASFIPAAPLTASTQYTVTVTTGVQDVAGDPLAANYVYSFTTAAVPPTVILTTPLNNATGVPVTQVISAVFSKPLNPSTISLTTFTVTGAGGVAITGAVAYAGTTATFTPTNNLPPNTLLTATITTGAQDLVGDALASNYVWTFRTVAAPTPPTVISTNPANNAVNVALNLAISATFSGAINPATINGTSFTLTAQGGAAVAGTVSYVAAGSVATFTPAASLAASTVYTATITTAVADTIGTSLAANYVWTFTTGAAPDTTPPTVILTNPLNLATNVPFNQAVVATFSKAINPATISGASFTLTGGGSTVAGLVTYAAIGNAATFTPTANLAASTTFTATITTAVTDLAGNALAANYVFTFTTGAAPDTTKPTVILTVPGNGALNVALNQTITATFSKAMDPLTITNATFQVAPSGGLPLTGTVAYNTTTFAATFTPSSPLVAGTIYNATVTTGAADLAGNTLGSGPVPNPWMFTTGTAVVLPPVNLNSAALFGAFGGGAGITNTGVSTVINNGGIGTTAASTLITGFHDTTVGCTYTEVLGANIGLVTGGIYTAPPPPTVGCPGEGTAATFLIAQNGASDALIAYNTLAAIPGGLDVSVCPGCGGVLDGAGELGRRTLAPGVYKSAPGNFAITTGDLTLDAKGDPNAYWVFQMGSSLTVGTPSFNRSVILMNGANPGHVFWQVGSGTTINGVLGGGTMVGTVISSAGIAISTAGVAAITTIDGRVLALNASVTMVNTVINVPAP